MTQQPKKNSQFYLLPLYLNLDFKSDAENQNLINRKNNWKNLKAWQKNFFDFFLL